MKITRRNAVLCVLWVVFVISLPIYFFLDDIQLRTLVFVDRKKFCGFIDKQIIQKRLWKQQKKK